MVQTRDIASDIAPLEHCPDFDERMTLLDGKTRGIPYPQPMYNCTADYALTQKKATTPDPDGYKGLEHCPDFDERFTLANGTTRAVPYPQTGYNCNANYAMAQ